MAYINLEHGRTNSTNGRTKSTISVWCKRSKLSNANQYIWGWGENNSSDSYCRFDTADNIEMQCDGADGTYNSSELFRDTNGWYHIVFSLDGSNGTANLRRRFWINGVQMDEGKSSISTFSDAQQGNVATQDLWIGDNPRSQQSGSLSPFYGYISHFHYCDGYSYAATDFAEFDANGVWSPKQSPSVNYGDNGIFLKMEDSSNMDLDSGTNNITLSTTGTVLSVVESPHNVFATMNPLDNYEQGSTFTIGNNKVEWNTDNKTNYANFAINKGKYYWEMKFANNTGGDYGMIGISVEDYRQPDDYPGHDSTGWSYYASSGNKYNNGGGSYGDSWTVNDIIGVAFDADTRTLWFSKNGVWQNSATISEIAAGTTTNAAWTGMGSAGDWFIPCMSGYDGNKAEFNFGNGYFSTTQITDEGTNASGIGKFEYDVPNNFTALCTKGLNN